MDHRIPSASTTDSSNDIPKIQTDSHGVNWNYRGEGNANLILALPESDRVLRLKKSTRENTQTEEGFLENSFIKRATWEIRWWRVFSTLLGRSYTIREDEEVHLGDLSACNLGKLNEILDKVRPKDRLHKRVASTSGVLFPDFTKMPRSNLICQGDTYTFELKPKHGWTPYTTTSKSGSTYAKCPYCLTQFLKLSKRKIERRSNYCPLDLFSGDRTRMSGALRSIIEEPQNNFKVFRNGEIVIGRDVADVLEELFQEKSFDVFEDLVKLLRETLLNNFNIDDGVKIVPKRLPRTDKSKSDVLQKIAELGLETCYIRDTFLDTLPSGCILERLLRLQLLDADVDLSGLEHGTGFEYIEGMLGVLENPGSSLDILTSLERSMLAATVKDCSVMLTFRSVMKDGVNVVGRRDIVRLDGHMFAARVSVIDLDLKPESRIDNYLRHIEDMFRACLEQLSHNSS